MPVTIGNVTIGEEPRCEACGSWFHVTRECEERALLRVRHGEIIATWWELVRRGPRRRA